MENFRVEMKIGLSDKRGSIVGQKTKKIGEFIFVIPMKNLFLCKNLRKKLINFWTKKEKSNLRSDFFVPLLFAKHV